MTSLLWVHEEGTRSMKRFSYSERDYEFGQTMLALRTSLGLTQAGLANLLGISRRAIGEWEAGSSYPKAHHLQHIIILAVQQRAFPPGQEIEKIRALWKASHQKLPLDEQWLFFLLDCSAPSFSQTAPLPVTSVPTRPPAYSAPGPRVDWEDALALPSFYGRVQELEVLTRWVVQEHCRVVSVLGMGGIGKSALVVGAMQRLTAHFEVVLFRSLRDAPSCEAVLETCLQVLSPEPLARVPEGLEQRLNLLLEYLRASHVLLVLDNLESLLEKGEVRGRLQPGYEGYGRLLRRVAETGHQSCVLLTSREKPAELRGMEGRQTPVRTLRLLGLDTAAGEQLLAEHEVVGTPNERAFLVQLYEGNPLALKIVSETIVDLFGGEISQFLFAGTVIFGSVADLLGEQFMRLSALEQTVLCWLAIMREPVTLEELLSVLVSPLPRVQVLEALDGLWRRCLIERGQRAGSFTLHSVVLEYVTTKLVTTASEEIQQGRLAWLLQHALVQANAKEYMRQTQERLLLAPLLVSLISVYQGRAEVEMQVCKVLDELREQADEAQGYGPANLIALLHLLRGNLRGLDLSHLAIRGAYLQGVEMQDTNLSWALIRESVFTETFDVITAVAISHDGHYWAAAGRRGEVRVWKWEKEAGQILHLIWQAHTDTTYAFAFSPEGHTLVSGSWDDTIKLWDVASGALLWSSWHTNGVQSLAIAPDGGMLATGGNNATVKLWDLQSGTLLQTLPHPGPILSVAWSPDGRMLATGSLNGQIRLWEILNTRTATCVGTLTGHTNRVLGLAFAPDGRTLASASWDGTVKLWEVASQCLHQTLVGHTDRVNRIAWSPDGRILASGGRDTTIWLWDSEEGSYRAAMQGHTASVNSLTFMPDNRSLLSGSDDGTMRLWDIASGQCMRVMWGYAASLFDVDWSPDGTQLAGAGSGALVILWDVASGVSSMVLHGHRGIVYGVGWSPNGQWLASSAWDDVISLWDTTTGTLVQMLRDPDNPNNIFRGVAWSPDGRLLASGTYWYGVQVWDMTVRSRHWVGRQLSTWIRHLAWSPDGTRLVGGGDDGHVYLWDASDGTLLQQLAGHQGVVTSVAWSPDGTQLASAGRSRGRGEMVVWDTQSWQCMRTFAGNMGIIYTVAWCARGDLLLSGDSDGMLRWWNVQNGECIRVRKAHTGPIRSLRCSPDGSRLASCGDDGAITLWDLYGGEHLHTLRRDRPYERLNITGIRGLTEAQKATLRGLGATSQSENSSVQEAPTAATERQAMRWSVSAPFTP